MGLYDSIHTGERCGQVKCLGKNVSDVVPGDHRTLHVIPQGERAEELKAELRAFIAAGASEYDPTSPTWLLFNGEPSDATSWQIKTRFGYIKFIDGAFTSWDTDPTSDLLVVDNYGAPLDDTGLDVNDTSHNLGWEEWGNLDGCIICHQLSQVVDPRAWRQKRTEERRARELARAAYASADVDPREIERRAAYARIEQRVGRVRRQVGR
jgi:hypothetical protein